MFNRLKLKLTLTNTAVAVLIFIIIFTGVYYTMHKTIIGQSDQLINLIAINIANSRNPAAVKMLRLSKTQPFIIIEVSDSGEIINYIDTAGLTMQEEQLKELVSKVMDLDKSVNLKMKAPDSIPKIFDVIPPPSNRFAILLKKLGTIRLSSGDTFLSSLVKRADGGIFMIFINTDYERGLLNSLALNLIFATLAGLILAFIGSLFMAGRAIKPIKTSWDRQKEFTADASHELRTPLSVMQTNLEIVMENKDETVESQLEWLENIYAENKHMTKLVGDLLLLARADSGQRLLDTREFHLGSTVLETVQPFIPVAQGKSIALDYNIEPEVKFYGDESKIKQLIVILIDNAIKYTPPGGSVSLELKNNTGNVEITVADTGEGIAKEHMDKIFQRFYRVDKARSRESGGTGLGLSIAGWIVKEHKGTIKVSSNPGEGTTFTVTLPKPKGLI